MKKKICCLMFCICLLSVLVQTSCSRRGNGGVRAEAAAGNVTENAPESGGGTEPSAQADDPDRIPAELSQTEGRDFLLFSEAAEIPLFPHDFEIGELQNLDEEDEQTALVIDAAVEFLSSFTAGQPDYSRVKPQKREFVKRNVDYGLSLNEVDDFRLGLIDITAKPVRAAVRLIGGGGFADGMLYFTSEDGWKILDFHMNFSDMSNREESKQTQWFPSGGM